MTRNKSPFILITLGCLTAYVGCGAPSLLKPDLSPPAIAANDTTALLSVSGCGYQPFVSEGYAYCRVTVGPVGDLALTFIAPPQASNCGPATTSCVDFTLFFPDQTPAYQGSIPRGQTEVTLPWTTLTKKSTFDSGDRGFWPYTYTIRWTGSDGNAYKTVSEGEIRLRVIDAQVCDPAGANCQAYVPLRTATDDPNFIWSWMEGTQEILMTGGARTYVSSPVPTASPSPVVKSQNDGSGYLGNPVESSDTGSAGSPAVPSRDLSSSRSAKSL